MMNFRSFLTVNSTLSIYSFEYTLRRWKSNNLSREFIIIVSLRVRDTIITKLYHIKQLY